MVKRLIGTGTTGSDGSCVIPYEGTGAGVVNLSVETEIDGSIVSETLNVLDCIFKDMGTSSDYGTWTSTDFTDSKISRNNEYTTLIPQDNYESQTKSSLPDTSLVIEFDMCLTYTTATGADFLRLIGSNTMSYNPTELGIVSGQWHHVKFTRDGINMIPNVDGTNKQTKAVNSFSTFKIVLNNTLCTDLKYKNFKVYPI